MLTQLIARNRNLSISAVKSTEAGVYFGKNAIQIGLADEVTTFPELREKIFINKKEVFNMTEQIKETINSDDLINQGKRIGYDSCRTEVLELIRLCNLSHMPEKSLEFIEQNINIYTCRANNKSSNF